MVEHLLLNLEKQLEKADRGLVLLRLEDRWQLATKNEYSAYVKRALDNRRNAPLSQAALEVLSVIAYNQPVSRSFIDQVRGVDSSSVVAGLLEKGLVPGGWAAGSARAPGEFCRHRRVPAVLRPEQPERPAQPARGGRPRRSFRYGGLNDGCAAACHWAGAFVGAGPSSGTGDPASRAPLHGAVSCAGERSPGLADVWAAPPEPLAPVALAASAGGPAAAGRSVQKPRARPHGASRPEARNSPAAKRLAQALHQAADTAAAAGQFVRRALWSLRIRHVRLVLPVYAPDAAACALACGKAHAELGAAFGLLQNFFRIEVEEVRIEPDFLDQRAEEFALSGQITARLLPLAIAGLRMVFRLADAKAE